MMKAERIIVFPKTPSSPLRTPTRIKNADMSIQTRRTFFCCVIPFIHSPPGDAALIKMIKAMDIKGTKKKTRKN